MYESDMQQDLQDPIVYYATWRRCDRPYIWTPIITLVRRQPHRVLWRCRSGRALVVLTDGEQELSAGQAISLRMDRVRWIARAGDEPVVVQWLSYHAPAAPQLPRLLDHCDGPLVDACIGRLVDIYRSRGGRCPEAQLWLAALLQCLVEDHPTSDRQPADPEEQLHQCCRSIDAEPGVSWRVEELARRCGWSTDHFARRFKQRYGMSPRAYITRARIAAAQALLRNTDDPIVRIADLLGFSDAFHFSRQFKQISGCAPRNWRARARAEMDD